MKAYLDTEFRCHVSAAPDLSPVETDFFNGKCDAFIEAYRYIPAGQSWTREDGTVFTGEMISPAEDITIPLAVQAEYEKMNAALFASYREGVNSV